MRNMLKVIRKLPTGLQVKVVAERSDMLELWVVTCRVNGDLYDQRQSEDAWKTVQQMIDAAVLQNEDAELDTSLEAISDNILSEPITVA